jgi:superfamily II DNA helicase RecQ
MLGRIMDCPSTPPRKTLNETTNTYTTTQTTPFPTPRRRKPPSTPNFLQPTSSDRPWPRIGKKVPLRDIISVAKQIFGYEPHPWQLKMFIKCAEGFDTFCIAGTGFGKSLVFALLAIAAELAGFNGIVIVVCPLKALEIDQVRRFDMAKGVKTNSGQDIRISAVAINEDNKDNSLFRELEEGKYRICYSSPEILLRNNEFKKLFRKERFRRQIIAFAIDEAHVIKIWKDSFRRDYDELHALRVITGSEVPCMALTTTSPTETFEVVYDVLGMGVSRNFWGIDMGTNRPNLQLWVRPIGHSNHGDLFVFIPENPVSALDFDKTIFYFRSRKLARKACRLCRRLITPEFQSILMPYTRTNSQEYKETVQDAFREGRIRMLFATTALGLGLDIPDIKTVVIYGLCDLDEMFQQGGRAGRDGKIRAKPWAFENQHSDEGDKPREERVSKKQAMDDEKRLRMDPNTRAFINCSQSNQCMRAFLCEYFRPKPNRRGFAWYITPALLEEVVEDENAWQGTSVEWEVATQVVTSGADCGCNARCCRINPAEASGVLTEQDRARIQSAMDALQPSSISPTLSLTATRARCSKPERDGLRDQLEDWRDREWASVGRKYPYYSRDWLLSDEDLKRIVDKAHIILNVPVINRALLADISRWIPTSPCLDSLCQLLEDFRIAHREREVIDALEHPRKRANPRVILECLVDPFVQGVESQPFNVEPSCSIRHGTQTWEGA